MKIQIMFSYEFEQGKKLDLESKADRTQGTILLQTIVNINPMLKQWQMQLPMVLKADCRTTKKLVIHRFPYFLEPNNIEFIFPTREAIHRICNTTSAYLIACSIPPFLQKDPCLFLLCIDGVGGELSRCKTVLSPLGLRLS